MRFTRTFEQLLQRPLKFLLRQITSLSNPINQRHHMVKHSIYRILFDCKTPPPLFPIAPYPLPHIKTCVLKLTSSKKTEMAVYVDTHHIRWRHLYVMPLASTFLDEETMDGCIRKAVEWCEGFPHTMPLTLKKWSCLKPSV